MASDQDQFNIPKNEPNKRVIFATGRIHPSESNSSYVIMGFIRWLCSEDKEAVELRKIARFIIVPMVNPDGVIIGNSRTSASGKDLNR
jgi:murein tripeptide amidase MpaA